MSRLAAKATTEAPKQAVLFEDVNSVECFETPDGVRPVLHDISFQVDCGQVLAVTGPSHFELRLLLEMMSNAHPYASGRCVLCERGMMRKKRMILPHVHYVGGTNMLFNNMSVLEYMMFITSHRRGDAIPRQKLLLQALEKCGLGFVCLSPIALLSPAERSVVCLFAATLTKSQLVIWNISRLRYEPLLVQAASKIARALTAQGKALVFSTGDYALAEALATHLLFIKDGGVAYSGETKRFSEKWDHLLFTLTAPDLAPYASIFRTVAPGCVFEEKNGSLLVFDPNDTQENMNRFFAAIAESGLCPTEIRKNTPNIGNAMGKAVAAQ